MKKGQAAMEFLFTYGYVLVVVFLLFTALIYYGFGDEVRVLVPKAIFSAPIMSSESPMIEENKILVSFYNNADDIIITNPYLDTVCNPSNVTVKFINGVATTSNNISNGDSFVLQWDCQNVLYDKINFYLGFKYLTKKGLERTHKGQIQGRIN